MARARRRRRLPGDRRDLARPHRPHDFASGPNAQRAAPGDAPARAGEAHRAGRSAWAARGAAFRLRDGRFRRSGRSRMSGPARMTGLLLALAAFGAFGQATQPPASGPQATPPQVANPPKPAVEKQGSGLEVAALIVAGEESMLS